MFGEVDAESLSKKSSEQLSTCVSSFREIIKRCKVLNGEGKTIKVHVLSVYLNKCKDRVVRNELQDAVKDFMQVLVDSLKDTDSFKVLLNKSSDKDQIMLKQFQVSQLKP